MSHRFDAQAIAAATRGTVRRAATAGRIVTDTRTIEPGDWFLALVGERFDGHAFVERAVAAGAVGVVVVRGRPSPPNAGAVEVDDTLIALQDLARAARARLSGPVVAVTGSSGKTTTRTLIALALSPLGHVHQTGANLNNHIGVPLTVLGGSPAAAATVVEMGTSAPGEIAVLARIGDADVRLITNVGPAHLEELGGLDGVAVEKGALFRSAGVGQTCCVNLDDPRLATMALPGGVRRVTWGVAEGADIRLLDMQIDAATLSTRAAFDTPAGRVDVRVPAPGAHIAHDAGGALAVAHALDVDLVAAGAALADYAPVGMRLRAERIPGGALALNDAYNANPASVEASGRMLAELGGRRIAVVGDMLELGPDEADWHRRTVGSLDALGLDLLVLVGPRMAAAVDAAVETPVLAFADPEQAVGPLRTRVREGDRVLFKGSRGARVERILQALQDGDAR